jgi:hypothetical protein
MTYNVDAVEFRNTSGTASIENLKLYINGLSSGKLILAIVSTQIAEDNVLYAIVHDA